MPKFSVKKPFTIIVAVLVIIILGVISFTNMTTDLLPKLELPYVMVMTTYPGASPEKIEKTVTKPLEKSLATTSGIKNITSVSQDNASVVVLEFNDGTNMDSAMIEMSGYIDLIKGQFDDMVQSPMLMKINPDMLPIMIASVDADGMDNIELSKYAENEVIPNFERIGGVASVDASGLVKKQIEITIDDDKIEHLNQIMLDSVDSKLGDANRELAKAKAEIADGEQKLTDESAAGIDKIASGSASVDGAVANLNALLSEETTLNANKQAFTMEKQGLTKADAMYVQLDGAVKAMGAMVAAGGGTDLGTAGINISAVDLTTLQTAVQGIIDSG
ncbi:MAG: efflux RND transporter permease subunit, partial [Oscillospiraceae bacterium]